MIKILFLFLLQSRGITSSKRRKHGSDDIDSLTEGDETSESAPKKHKLLQLQSEINEDLSSTVCSKGDSESKNIDIPGTCYNFLFRQGLCNMGG